MRVPLSLLVVSSITALSATGIQAQSEASGWEVGVTLGQSLVETGVKSNGQFIWDCDETGALISYLGLEVAKDWLALHVAFNHTDWPWMALGAAGESSTQPPNVIQRHGDAIEAYLLFRPAEAFDLRATHREGYTFNPHVGLGIHASQDADDQSAAAAPIFLAQGQTNLMLAYGFTLDVHPGALARSGVALRVGLTGKRSFRSEGSFDTDDGIETFAIEDGNWATVTFGVVFRPGS